MSKQNEVSVIVYSVKRGRSSAMGNPAYVFSTDRGVFKTQTDTGAAYRLENDFTVGETLDVPVTLITTPAGRVFDWKLGA